MLGFASAAALLPALGGRSIVRADVPTFPRRIVFFYTEQGTLRPSWAPTAPGAPDYMSLTAPWATSNFTFGELHGPLAPHKNKLLVLDGLDMLSTGHDPLGTNGHLNGMTHALVGANRATPQLGGDVSLDQYIARKINKPAVTRFTSLEALLNPFGGDPNVEQAPFYQRSGEPLPMSADPASTYDRLLGAATAEGKAAEAASLVEQKIILTRAQKNFSELGTRLGKTDRDRLDAHADAIGDLSARLGLGPNLACGRPDRAIVDVHPADTAAAYANRADVMMRLVQTALACDLTRVASIYVEQAPDAAFGYRSIESTDGFHDMIHKTNGANPLLGNNADAMKIVKGYHAYNASLYAKFLSLLDGIPEGDGTLLDHTAVVWCGQLAGGDHSVEYLPYVIGGGMGGQLATGRYVRYPRTPDKGSWPNYSHGPAHNDLLCALANKMGVVTSTFGNPLVCRGPLAGLT